MIKEWISSFLCFSKPWQVWKNAKKKHSFTSNSLNIFCPRPSKSTNTFQGLRNTISWISSHAKFRPRHKAAVAIRALVGLWVFRKEWIGKLFDRFDTQMLHVRKIYLHLAQIYCKCRYIFHTWSMWDSWWLDSDTYMVMSYLNIYFRDDWWFDSWLSYDDRPFMILLKTILGNSILCCKIVQVITLKQTRNNLFAKVLLKIEAENWTPSFWRRKEPTS